MSIKRIAICALVTATILLWHLPHEISKHVQNQQIQNQHKHSIIINHTVPIIPQLSSEELYAKGLSFAKTIATNQTIKSENFGHAFNIPDSEWFVDITIIDHAIAQGQPCLVYSFGIAEDDIYTNFMAGEGCQVFAFDPTVRHPHEWRHNVLFYPWGIRNSAKRTEWTHPVYGNITGSLFTLPEIVKKLGHDDGRTITAIKFDCEGCEYGAFKDIIDHEQTTGESFNQILSLSTEFHMAKNLGMVDKDDIANIHYAELFLNGQNCETVHYRINGGLPGDRDILVELTQAGVYKWVCCYEYGFSCGQ